jgi:hypothetical protein
MKLVTLNKTSERRQPGLDLHDLNLSMSPMRKTLFPINVWAYQGNAWRLFNFCESINDALQCAKKLPFTPVVLSAHGALPFNEEMVSEQEFGELTGEEFPQGLAFSE